MRCGSGDRSEQEEVTGRVCGEGVIDSFTC